jgi:putative flippase GtrA
MKLLADLFCSEKFRFLLVGLINTVFGYFSALAVYFFLIDLAGLLHVLLLANVIGITFSFITYKIFVFRTTGSWLNEYFRSYLVYGASALFGMALVSFLVMISRLPFWLAQLISLVSVAIFSYFMHKRFTFRAGGWRV